MEKNANPIDSGGVAEEAIREYFSSLGAFVIRGVPIRSGFEDVSDVDLWAYTRINANSRNITIVDIKNKRRGKPFERVVWVKGLQTALRADEAIIATQGAKPSVYDFAQHLEVKVISGHLFDALVKKYADNKDRHYAEHLNHEWSNCFIDRRSVKSIVETAKSHFAYGIQFSGLNNWIDEACELLRAAVEREKLPGPFTRAAYLISSFVGIGVDALAKRHSMSDYGMRTEYFRKGLIFGGSGLGSGKSFIDFAESVVTEHLDATGASAAKIRAGFNRSVENMPIGGLVENFSRSSSTADLFRGAVQLERAAYSRDLKPAREAIGAEGKALLGLLADYAGIPRRELIGDKFESLKTDTLSDDSSRSADLSQTKLNL